MAVSTNYSGRSIDLFIAQGAEPVGDHKITYGFGDVGGEVTTGIQKLAQTWAILFLTELGSIPYHPELGTGFLQAIRFSRIKDTVDVQTQFAMASQAVTSQLNLVADQTIQPDDERLQSAVLTNVDLDKSAGLLTITVTLTSQAAGSTVVILPVPLAIQ